MIYSVSTPGFGLESTGLPSRKEGSPFFLLYKIIQNIRFRATVFNQSLQKSEYKKARLLSHNVFRHRLAPNRGGAWSSPVTRAPCNCTRPTNERREDGCILPSSSVRRSERFNGPTPLASGVRSAGKTPLFLQHPESEVRVPPLSSSQPVPKAGQTPLSLLYPGAGARVKPLSPPPSGARSGLTPHSLPRRNYLR